MGANVCLIDFVVVLKNNLEVIKLILFSSDLYTVYLGLTSFVALKFNLKYIVLNYNIVYYTRNK